MSLDSIFGNKTEPVTHWVQEPDIRGTWSLVSSCFFTLLLCIWTALHLNIRPRYPEANKLAWLSLTLASPEVALFLAWTQREEAARVAQGYNRCFQLDEEKVVEASEASCGDVSILSSAEGASVVQRTRASVDIHGTDFFRLEC